eukprot:2083686-Rhodomonas_salina.1
MLLRISSLSFDAVAHETGVQEMQQELSKTKEELASLKEKMAEMEKQMKLKQQKLAVLAE